MYQEACKISAEDIAFFIGIECVHNTDIHSVNTIARTLGELRARNVCEMRLAVDEQAIKGLKFSECLPHNLALDMLQMRLGDSQATQRVLEQPARFIRDVSV